MAKPQSKAQKKIDNNVRRALAAACEQCLEGINGFQKLTHQADYSNFPASLLITCVFDTDESQQQACQNDSSSNIQKLIQAQLLKVGIILKAPKRQIIFDSVQSRS